MCLQDFPEQRFEWKNENQIGSFVIDAAGLNPNQHRCQHAAQPPYTPYTLHPTLILHPTPYTLHSPRVTTKHLTLISSCVKVVCSTHGSAW